MFRPERFRTGYAAAIPPERLRMVHSMTLQSLSDERLRTAQNGSEQYNASGTVQHGSEAWVPMPPERLRTAQGHAVSLPPFLRTVHEHAAGGSES